MSLDCESVVAIGKVIFIPDNKNDLFLPVMNLLLLNDRERGEIYPWRAVCIDLELDAVGDTMDEAWSSLKETISMYIDMQKKVANNSVIETAKNIIKEAFTDSAQKQEYIRIYRQVKLKKTMKSLESTEPLKSAEPRDPVLTERRMVEAVESEHKELIKLVIEEFQAAA